LSILSICVTSFVTAVSVHAESTIVDCSHDEALEMGARLHRELDVSSDKFRSRSMSEAEKQAYRDAFFELMDASDLALRGKDAEACRRYREIAQRMKIDLD